MPEFEILLSVLIVINIIVYGLLVYGYLRQRLWRPPHISELDAAFRLLEDALIRSFPELPKGFTWEEGIGKAKSLNLRIDWGKVEELLSRYEAQRYGVSDTSTSDTGEIVRLAYSLPKIPRHDLKITRTLNDGLGKVASLRH